MVPSGILVGMRLILRLFRSDWIWVTLLVIISGALMAMNYRSGTWLSGWDALHTEFDFGLNFFRQIWGVWREEQGLGALSVHSHMAELPRTLLLYFMSWFLPITVLRWSYLFVMLVLGSVGVYFFFNNVLGREGKGTTAGAAAFLGAGFYLLNYSTLQHFVVPFEMFLSAFGLIGWIFLTVILYLETGKRKGLLWFALAMLFAAPMAYAATLWYVFFGCLLSFVILFGILERKKAVWKRVVNIVGLSLAVNAFWLLPSIYSTLRANGVVMQAKINRLFSLEAWFHNKAYGTPINVLQFKNHLFSWLRYDVEERKFRLLLEVWDSYSQNPWIVGISVGLFLMGIIGVLIALTAWLRKKHNKVVISILPILVISLIFVINENFPFNGLFRYLRENSEVLREGLRFPFTKFSIPLQFSVAMFFAYASLYILNLLKRVRLGVLRGFYVGGVLVAMVVPVLPSFRGDFIHSLVKSEIPSEYFDIFEWFKQKESGRVAVMPMPSMWGWEYYDWSPYGYGQQGYQGAGFLQFGVDKPLLVRDFDRWSPYNESFYNEASEAVYGGNAALLGKVLEKYGVRYVLVDGGIISTGENTELKAEEIKKMLSEISASEVTRQGFLSVYDTGHGKGEEIYAPGSYVLAYGETVYGRHDVVYESMGTYVSGSGEANLLFPFVDLMREEVANVKYGRDFFDRRKIELVRSMAGILDPKEIMLPAFKRGGSLVFPVAVEYRDSVVSVSFDDPIRFDNFDYPNFPKVVLDIGKSGEDVIVGVGSEYFDVKAEQTVYGTVEMIVGEDFNIEVFGKGRDVVTKGDFGSGVVSKCWERPGRKGTVEAQWTQVSLVVTTVDAAGCLPMSLGALNGLVRVTLPYRSSDGARPNFCVVEEGEEGCLNDDVFYSTGTSKEWKEVSRTVRVQGDNYLLDVTARPPIDEGLKWSVDYREPRITLYSMIESLSLNESVWSDFMEEKRFEVVGTEEDLTVSLSSLEKLYRLAELGRLEAVNCDTLQRGVVDKETDAKGTYSLLRASNRGAACDGANLEGVIGDKSYLLRVKGRAMEGRGAKLYLSNDELGRSELETILGEGSFDKSYSLLGSVKGEGYFLSVETRSFGEMSANEIGEIGVYSLPTEWLAGVRVVGGDNGKLTRGNDLHVENVRKMGDSIYNIKLSGEGLLVLDQSYEDGWMVFDGSLLGRKAKHVKVNGWGNGWLIEGGVEKVLIFYWPQILEWIGLGVLIVVAVIALWSRSVRF